MISLINNVEYYNIVLFFVIVSYFFVDNNHKSYLFIFILFIFAYLFLFT